MSKPAILSILFASAMSLGLYIQPLLAYATTPAMCTEQYQPVCAAYQVQCIKAPCYPVYRTYSNTCFMNTENATLIHDGECTAGENGALYTGTTTETKPYVPPATCTAWFDGCNSCSKRPNGSTICTMKACYPEQRPENGYCSMYATSTTPVPVKPVPHPVIATTTIATSTIATITPVISEASTTTTATTTRVQDRGFVHYVLDWIATFFRSLFHHS